jgi:hypothetical protein
VWPAAGRVHHDELAARLANDPRKGLEDGDLSPRSGERRSSSSKARPASSRDAPFVLRTCCL